MNKMRERALAHFPIVLLTLISIIQALALELLWGKLSTADYLWDLSVTTIIIWGMFSATLMGIVQIWITYSTLVIGFTWRPSLADSILPFVVGILEFLMINLIDESLNVLWLYVLASLFVIVNWIVHSSFKRARLEPENAAYFRNLAPASLKDFRGAIAIIVILVLFGMIITVLEAAHIFALLAIGFANTVIVLQIVNSRRLWNSIIDVEE